MIYDKSGFGGSDSFRQDAEHLQFVMKASGIGIWEMELSTNMVIWDDRCRELFEVADGNHLPYDQAVRYIHTDDRNKVDAAVQAAIAGVYDGLFDLQCRITGTANLRWVRFCGQASFDDDGAPLRFGGIAQDVTSFVHTARMASEAQTMAEVALEGANAGFFRIRLQTDDIEYSPAFSRILTGNMKPSLTRQDFIAHIHRDDRPRREEAYTIAAKTGMLNYEARVIWDDGSVHWIQTTGTYIKNEDGKEEVFTGTLHDITERVEQNRRLLAGEARFRDLIEQSPIAIGLLGSRKMIIEVGNDKIFALWGKDASITGLPLIEALPEIKDQPFLSLLEDVYDTGIPFTGTGVQARLEQKGKLEDLYFDFAYTPLRNADGEVTGVMVLATDVTEQVVATRKLEASESRLRSLVESAPFPIGVYTGREMRIWLANQAIIDIYGKGNDVVGKLYTEVLPELENQEIFDQLDRVFMTGIAFHNRNQRVDILVNNKVKSYYFNYSFTPLFDNSGQVYGVMNTAADITDLVLAIQRAETAENTLHSALALADLGTWTLEISTGLISFSSRIQEWFGMASGADQYAVYRQIHSNDRDRVINAVARALDPETREIYDENYTITALNTGRERILHAQGQAVFDPAGKPLRMSGTIRDVTIHKQLQLALENEVQQRTEELAASNEELRVTNEEVAESNKLLVRSNEELAQFAYVASHDLQEPLRKIRMFAGMLSKENTLPPALAPLVTKIDKSTERMVLLICDLLEFSSLLKSDAMARPVNLAEVAANVMSDFELLIEDKKARVIIGNLPEIQAVALQMNQLFYNLLGNALKFSKSDIPPVIEINSVLVSKEETGLYIFKPLPFARYYRITIQDNGIGFETKYAEHIFEVFKRLHGREHYPGSGIGLAMCRRIADNHHGRLYAESEPGKGSVFHLFLPDKQQNYSSELPAGFQWINQ